VTTIAPEVIESLETWEEIGDAARLVASDLDTGRFTLGDIANRCARVYGTDSIGKLAAEIRVAKRQTLYEYAKLAARFQPSARAEFMDMGLTFSHFRAAAADGENAEYWLAKAADDGLPVAALAREIKQATGKPVPPVKLWEGECIVIDQAFGCLTLRTDADIDVGKGQRVIVKLYAAEAE
jgi:hypothetical protein